jgi:hypothetical protein
MSWWLTCGFCWVRSLGPVPCRSGLHCRFIGNFGERNRRRTSADSEKTKLADKLNDVRFELKKQPDVQKADR